MVARLTSRNVAVGQLLMDQTVVAGIGNIYRAELLFRARLDPHTPGRRVPAELARALWDDWAVLLTWGSGGRIVTRDVPGSAADPDGRFWVYHRTGLPCRVSGTPVVVEEMAGRKLYWCRCARSERRASVESQQRAPRAVVLDGDALVAGQAAERVRHQRGLGLEHGGPLVDERYCAPPATAAVSVSTPTVNGSRPTTPRRPAGPASETIPSGPCAWSLNAHDAHPSRAGEDGVEQRAALPRLVGQPPRGVDAQRDAGRQRREHPVQEREPLRAEPVAVGGPVRRRPRLHVELQAVARARSAAR